MVRFLLLILTAKVLFTGNPNPMNSNFKKYNYAEGDHKFYYFNNSPEEFFKIKNGNLDGLYQAWYKNGQLEETDHFDNGTFVDTCKQYSEDGNLKIIDAYNHDTLIYYCEYNYYSSGVLKSARWLNFDKDSLTICPFLNITNSRKWTYFDANLTFEKLKSHGMYVEYYKSGAKSEETVLVNDKFEGEDKGYYEDGKLGFTGYCHNNLDNGLYTFYNEDGTINKTENWKDGKRIKE